MLLPLVFPYWVGSFNVSLVSSLSSDNIIFSIILPPIGVLEIGRRSFSAWGGFCFGIGTISEILKAFGKIPVLKKSIISYGINFFFTAIY